MKHTTSQRTPSALYALIASCVTVVFFSHALGAEGDPHNLFNLFSRDSNSTFTFRFGPAGDRDPFAVPADGELRSRGWSHYFNPGSTNPLHPELFIDPSRINWSRIGELPPIQQEQLLAAFNRQQRQAQLDAQKMAAQPIKILSSDEQDALRRAGKCPCGRTRAQGCSHRSEEERQQRQEQHAQDLHEQQAIQKLSASCKRARALPTFKQTAKALKPLEQELAVLAEHTHDTTRQTLLHHAEHYLQDARSSIKNDDTWAYHRAQNRFNAALQSASDPQAVQRKQYTIALHVRSTAPENLDLAPFESCTGNALQQELHDESVEIMHRTSEWYMQNNYWPEVHDLSDLLFYSADLSRIFAEGHLYKPCVGTLDMCWKLLKSLGNGGLNITRNSLNTENIAAGTASGVALGTLAVLCGANPYAALAFGLFSGYLHLSGNTHAFFEAKKRAQHLLDSDKPEEIISGMFQIAGEIAASSALMRGVRVASKKLSSPKAILSSIIGEKTTDSLAKAAHKMGEKAGRPVKVVADNFQAMCEYAKSVGHTSREAILAFVSENPKLCPPGLIREPVIRAWVKLHGQSPNLFNEKHIQHGEIKHSKGQVRLTGCHVEATSHAILTQITLPVDRHGIYEAEVMLNGLTKKSNFFPKHFTFEDVKQIVNDAFSNPISFRDRGFVGETKDGMQIVIWFDKVAFSQGKYIIDSAYPLHETQRIIPTLFQ